MMQLVFNEIDYLICWILTLGRVAAFLSSPRSGRGGICFESYSPVGRSLWGIGRVWVGLSRLEVKPLLT